MYLSLYTGSLFNSFLVKLLILFHIFKYYFSTFSSLTKWFMYLLFLSKYLAYAFIWEIFMQNGDRKALLSCLYQIKYLNESLPYDFLSDNVLLLISTSLILIGFLLLWKALLMIYFLQNVRLLVPFLYNGKKKKSKFLILIF